MLIDDIIPSEDGHAQERSLLDQVLPLIERRDLVIDAGGGDGEMREA